MKLSWRLNFAICCATLFVAGSALAGSNVHSRTNLANLQTPANAGALANAMQAAEAADFRCDTHKYSSNSDLCAQWKAADAATSSALAAWIVGAAGLVIALATLAAASMAALYARNAAVETKRGADAAQNSYYAFVNLERSRLVAEVTELLYNPPHIALVRVNLTNLGKSTAAVLFAQCGFAEGCQFPETFERTIRIDRAMSDGETQTFSIDAIPQSVIPNEPFVGGYVQYRSAFGTTHRAYFLGRVCFVPEEKSSGYYRSEHYVAKANALYCSREERESRFGWPSDS